VGVDDLGERHLPQLHLLLEDQMEQQVEGALEHRRADRVRHRGRADRPSTAPNGIPARGKRLVVSAPMPRVRSGVHACGEIHLGNYLGAVRHWVAAQELSVAPDQTLYCVVDLHGLTLPWDPATYAEATRRTAMLLLAAGLDPEQCTLFV